MKRARLLGVLFAVAWQGGCGQSFFCGVPGVHCEENKTPAPDAGQADAARDVMPVDSSAPDKTADSSRPDGPVDLPRGDLSSPNDVSPPKDVASPNDVSSPADRPPETRPDATLDIRLVDGRVDLGSDARTDAASDGIIVLPQCCTADRQCGASPNPSPNCAGVQCGPNCPGPTCGICGVGLDCNDGVCTAGCSKTVRVINERQIPPPIDNGCDLFPYLVVQAGTSQQATWVDSLKYVDVKVKQGQTGSFKYQCCWVTVPACVYDPTNCTVPGFGPAVCYCDATQTVSVTATTCDVQEFVACS